MKSKYDAAVVGGAGHVGIPLSLVLADRGLRTLIYDLNQDALDKLKSGKLPFIEDGAEILLKKALKAGKLGFTKNPAELRNVPVVLVTIGTPIDEFHNPSFSLLTRCLDQLLPYFDSKTTIILRSTVAPGTSEHLTRHLKQKGFKGGLAYCPERVVQGKGIEEIHALPQLISATSPKALAVSRDLFSRIAPTVIEMTPMEAEFGKLICNAARYMLCAVTNQLYMICEQSGVDYRRLLGNVQKNYPRMAFLPGPGFAAGPCLMKDTMQLFASSRHSFALGPVAMNINEGLPNFIVSQLRREMDLKDKTVGILGMAFKAECDDIRDSLSYRLRKVLRFEGARVLCSDEFVKDREFVPGEKLVRESDIIIIGVPHRAYKTLRFPANTKVVNLWGNWERPGFQPFALLPRRRPSLLSRRNGSRKSH